MVLNNNHICFNRLACFFFRTARYIEKSEKSAGYNTAEDLWDLMIYKRKLQLRGKYPVVYNCNGQLRRVYVNQRAGAFDVCKQLEQQQQQYQQSLLPFVKNSPKNIPIISKPVIEQVSEQRSKTRLKMNPSIIKTNLNGIKTNETIESTKRTHVTELKPIIPFRISDETLKMIIARNNNMLKEKEVKRQPPFVYRRLSAQNNEFTVPFRNIVPAIKLTSEKPMALPTITEPNFQQRISDTNENVHQQSVDVITSTAAPIFISSTFTSVESEFTTMSTILAVETTSSYITTSTNIQNDPSSEVSATTVADSDSESNSESDLDSFSSSTMNPQTKIYVDESTTSMDYHEITTEQTTFTHTIGIDTTTLSNEVNTDSMNTFDNAEETSELMDINTNEKSDQSQKTYFSDQIPNIFEDEYDLNKLVLDQIYHRNWEYFSRDEQRVIRSLFKGKWKHIKKEMNNLKYIATNEDPVFSAMFNNI